MAEGPTRHGAPLLIDMGAAAPADPAAAPALQDVEVPVPAMARAAAFAARRPSGLARAFWTIFAALGSLIVSLAAWNWVTGLIAAVPVLGWIAAALTGALLAVLLLVALREAMAFARLARLDSLQREAAEALANADLRTARHLAGRLSALYAGRAEMEWARARMADLAPEQFDADAVLGLAETVLLTPLDAAAQAEVESAARQVATVTAVVPLALADVATALAANLRMIRRIAEVYGGRAGTFGAWRLTKTVMTHLVATGAVAVGDDLIGSVAGGSILSKLSRRFGEGVVNGALTARVGIAAMEVCRPLPFRARDKPLVTTILRRAVSGLFGSGEPEA